MKRNILLSLTIVLTISLITVVGSAYAYYSSSDIKTGISGEVRDFYVTLAGKPIFEATKLVPLKDADIVKSISKTTNPCTDNSANKYEVCSLYELNLKNNGDNIEKLNGYIETTSTTYSTNNLKYQIFTKNGSVYNSVTMIDIIPQTVGNKTYFKNNASNLQTTTVNANSSITFYLALWLSDTGTSQNEDFEKSYTGKVVFESVFGDKLEASFTA